MKRTAIRVEPISTYLERRRKGPNPSSDCGWRETVYVSGLPPVRSGDGRESLSRDMILQELNVVLIRTLYFQQARIIAAVVCSLIVAGLLNWGIIGIGMPVVALPLLSLFIDVESAVMLLSSAFDLQQRVAGAGGRKTGRCLMQLTPDSRIISRPLPWSSKFLLALDANVAEIIAGLVVMGVGGVTLLAPKLQLQSRLFLPTGVTFGFFGGDSGSHERCRDRSFFIFLLAKGLRGKCAPKEASLYLVVPPACWQFF